MTLPTLAQFSSGLRQKKFSAREITQACLDNISARDKNIGAFLAVYADSALQNAVGVDEMIARGEKLHPLAGAPVAIKDNMLVKGEITTAGSQILRNYRASYDAHVIQKLKAAQVTLIGKTNLDEFAMGNSTENSGFHTTKNPHDLTRIPGGSSGGSAAAVAAGFAVGALGSDTGGSIRQPAGMCGIVGLKPTYGAVSRSGLIPMASSLDQIGPLTQTAEDAALLFQAIRGEDSLDATSLGAPPEGAYDERLLDPDPDRIKKIRIGLPSEYYGKELSPTIGAALDEVKKRFQGLDFALTEISLPHTRYALSAYYIIVPAEISANLARFDGIRYERPADLPYDLKTIYRETRGRYFGAEPKRRIILGTFVLSSGYYDAYYETAQKVRKLVRHDFDEAFKKVDVLLTPVSPHQAWKIGEKANDPLALYLEDVFTLPVNMAGLPGLSLPCRTGDPFGPTQGRPEHGRTGEKLPIGFQLIGKRFAEPDLLGLGRLYEENFS